MRVTVIGGNGFVGSAFVRCLSARPELEVIAVTRANYGEHVGKESDVVIEAACNSKKFLSDKEPMADFEASVTHRFRTPRDFPAALHLHISSVDVYSHLSSPDHNREESAIDIKASSNYGFHKLLAEQLVQHYARSWLIVRLAGMVGPNLKKNPVFDILNSRPIFLHPDSGYQFISTEKLAEVVWKLCQSGSSREVFNLAGDGMVSPREIASMAGKDLDLSALPADSAPRIVNVSTDKIRRLFKIPQSRETIMEFLQVYKPAAQV